MNLLVLGFVLATSVFGSGFAGQEPGQAPAVVRLDGEIRDAGQPRTGAVVMVVSVYAGQDDTAPLWSEEQNIALDAAGRYTVFAGASVAGGLPRELFTANSGQWIGVGVKGEAEQPRVRLLSIPYAVNAGNADTLGGTPAANFVRSEDLTESVKSTLESEGKAGALGAPGDPTAAGTPNFVAKFGAGGAADTNSAIFELGGFVGIGMTAPPTALTLPQDGQISWTNAAGTNQRVTLYGSSGNYLSVNLLGVEKMRVNPTGVAVGQSTSASILTVPQDQVISWANPGGTARIGLTGYSSNAFGIGVLGVEKVRLESNGYLGVGTSVPTSLLHVQGSSLTQNVDIKLVNTVGHTWRIGEVAGAGKFAVHDSTAAGTRLVIDEAGNIGIGTSTPTAKLQVAGNVTVDGNIGAKYQDVAEWVETDYKLEAGTVVIVDLDATNRVVPSTKAYDTSVAGAVSAQPGIVLGEAGDNKSLIAQSGRVKIKADASFGAIKPGDLLVTSPTPGHAMLSKPVKVGKQAFHRPGTLVGKALEGLPSGKGEILVLLTLQ